MMGLSGLDSQSNLYHFYSYPFIAPMIFAACLALRRLVWIARDVRIPTHWVMNLDGFYGDMSARDMRDILMHGDELVREGRAEWVDPPQDGGLVVLRMMP